MLILIKFNAESFQQRKIQSIHIKAEGPFMGCLLFVIGDCWGRHGGVQFTLSDYFRLSFRSCSSARWEHSLLSSLRRPTVELPAGTSRQVRPLPLHHHNQLTQVTNRPIYHLGYRKQLTAAQLSRNETVTHWGGDVRTAALWFSIAICVLEVILQL